jgi:hypothetical protein
VEATARSGGKRGGPNTSRSTANPAMAAIAARTIDT